MGPLFPLLPPQVFPMFVQCSAEGGPNSLICYIKPIKKINDISWFIAKAFAFRDGVKNEEEKRHFLFKLRYSKKGLNGRRDPFPHILNGKFLNFFPIFKASLGDILAVEFRIIIRF